MMRKHANIRRDEIERDFEQRVQPGLTYCQRVGNIMGATVMLSLASAVDQGSFDFPRRIGCFSYGSGCSSEFYSGVVTASGQQKVKSMRLEKHLNSRHRLTMDEYESLLEGSHAVKFGTRDVVLNTGLLPDVWKSILGSTGEAAVKRIFLAEIKGFHRQYAWV
jgi:polyketide biosynthesis 3-hydroxy-3-methylglutaryl-CoA synthase-like enzyme PksG